MSKKDIRLKKDRQISRDKRNALRHEIQNAVKENYLNGTFQLLFIVSETENMERILLQKKTLLKSGKILTLPNLTKEMIDFYDSKYGKVEGYKEYIEYYFGIRAESAKLVKGTRLVVLKGLKKLPNFKPMVEISVRPYNEYTWFTDAAASLNGYRIFGRNQLKRYFVLDKDYKDLYVFQDTIAEISLYRAVALKIDEEDFLINYSLCEKRKPNTNENAYALMTLSDNNLMRIYAKEAEERRELILTKYGKTKNRLLKEKN